MTCMPITLENRAVAHTVEPNMDGRKMPGTWIHLQELWEDTHWQSVCRISEHSSRPRQRETQRYDAKQRSVPRQDSQSR